MANKTPGRAAIYTRISDDKEDDREGVDRQEEDSRALADRLGLSVVEVFTENSTSASTRSIAPRPKYEDMLERARRGEFTHILAYSNSRLTRRLRENIDLIDLSRDHGVIIKTVASGEFDLNTADGRATALTLATWDQAEAERVGERVKRAVDQRKQRGTYHGSTAPFGFKVIPKDVRTDFDLEHDSHEVAMINEAVTRLLDANDSLYSIVRDWNASGKRTRGTRKNPDGTPWRQGVLRKALTNPALIARTRPVVAAGTRAPIATEGYPARWEPIIDVPTFNALKDRLVERASAPWNPTGKKSSKYALGGGLTVCGRCGKPLYGMVRNDQPMKLICKAAVNDAHENHPIDPDTGFSTGRVTVRYDLLEEYVFEQFVAHLNDMPYWQAHKHDPDPAANSKVAEAERLKDAEEAKIRRAEDQAFDGLIDPVRLREMIDASRAKVRDLDAQIADLKGKPSRRDNVIEAFGTPEWILAQREKFPSDVKRTLLKLMIERIVINDWPADLQKTASMRGSESPAQFEARRRDLQREGMARRVQIEWRG